MTHDRKEQGHSSRRAAVACSLSTILQRRSENRRGLQWHYRFFLLLWLAMFSLGLPTTSRAHGGVIIDSGFTEHYEWLVSIDPFPTLMGEAMVTLLIYDIASYEPMNDFSVALYQVAPDSAVPCCQPEHHEGPVELTIDPALYPGDYSNLIALDQPGEWQLHFLATAPAESAEQSFEVTVTLSVNATMGGSSRIAIGIDSPAANATATAFAQNVADARQQDSPLAAPTSPLADGRTTTTDTAAASASTAFLSTVRDPSVSWFIWGGLALLPILLIGWLVMQTGRQE